MYSRGTHRGGSSSLTAVTDLVRCSNWVALRVGLQYCRTAVAQDCSSAVAGCSSAVGGGGLVELYYTVAAAHCALCCARSQAMLARRRTARGRKFGRLSEAQLQSSATSCGRCVMGSVGTRRQASHAAAHDLPPILRAAIPLLLQRSITRRARMIYI